MSTWPADDVTELVAESPAVGFLSKARLSVRAIRDLLERAPARARGERTASARPEEGDDGEHASMVVVLLG